MSHWFNNNFKTRASTPLFCLETTGTPPTPERRSDDTSASQWADMATKPSLDEPSTESPKPRAPKSKATNSSKLAPKAKPKPTLIFEQVSRFYSPPPSKSHGYQFLYFISRGCERISHVRAGFQVLGLSQNRILDIHYPTNNVISFLVHNNDYYTSTVIDAMAKLPASKLMTDCDPCAPTLLRDPKYANTVDPLFLKPKCCARKATTVYKD